jgi:hypothetical protein
MNLSPGKFRAALLLFLIAVFPACAWGDNCGSLSDCYGTAGAAVLVAAAIALAIGIAITLPIILEAVAGMLGEWIAASTGLEGIAGMSELGEAAELGEAVAGVGEEAAVTEEAVATEEAAATEQAAATEEGAASEGTAEAPAETTPEETTPQSEKPAGTDSNNYAPKIEKQLESRGWTKESVNDTISDPDRTVPTRDTRHLPGGGRMDDPATAFINADGSYVVRNDVTGDIVQVSDRFDPDWKLPF